MKLTMLKLALCLSCACGNSASSPATDASPDATSSKCDQPLEISSKEELIAAMVGEQIQVAEPYLDAPLSISQDLVITGSFTLTPNDLPLAESCGGPCDGKRRFFVGPEAPSFHGSQKAIAGVRCDASVTIGTRVFCDAVTFDNTRVRVRNLIVFSTETERVAVIEIVPNCSAECGEGELWCASMETCFSITQDSSTYCRFCLGNRRSECACESPDALEEIADDESCSYAVSGDVICGGTCTRGVCGNSADPFCDGS